MNDWYILPNGNIKNVNGLEIQPDKDWFPTTESMMAFTDVQRALGKSDVMMLAHHAAHEGHARRSTHQHNLVDVGRLEAGQVITVHPMDLASRKGAKPGAAGSVTVTIAAAAHTVACHPEQGWSLLCNGVIVFEDTGELLPDGRTIAPHRGPAVHALAA